MDHVLNFIFSKLSKGELIGDLTKKNCTTVMSNFSNIHNDSYFFRLDCPMVRFTFHNAVNIITQTGTTEGRPL